MKVITSTIALTVVDVAASAGFFVEHLGYRQQQAAAGFASLTRDDAALDVVFLQQGLDVLPDGQRSEQASGLVVAFTVTDLDAELARLQHEGVAITLPLQEHEWGERLFQVTDPSHVVVELVAWNDGSGPSTWTDNG